MFKINIISLLLLVFLLGCSEKSDKNNQESTTSEEPIKAPGPWIDLLAGDSLNQWKGYLLDSVPTPGWTLEDGILKLTREEGAKRTGGLITKQKFENFELTLEFNVTPMANSGVFYRVGETVGQPIYYDAPEYQIIDNHWYLTTADKAALATHLAGDNYDLHASDSNYLHPIESWNSAKIVINQNKVEHWLNGVMTVTYEIESPSWNSLVANSKFATHENYGKIKNGHIGLQDHGNEVWFKNIKIRNL